MPPSFFACGLFPLFPFSTENRIWCVRERKPCCFPISSILSHVLALGCACGCMGVISCMLPFLIISCLLFSDLGAVRFSAFGMRVRAQAGNSHISLSAIAREEKFFSLPANLMQTLSTADGRPSLNRRLSVSKVPELASVLKLEIEGWWGERC